MVKLLQLLLTYKFRTTQPAQKNGGFTLIELLVGIILAFLVILPLLGFMVNLLQTDRQEQAKANSEQELQAAADYIARDLEQAVYIYDGYGLARIQASLPTIPNIPNGNSVPVLAFWKRQIFSEILNRPNGRDDAFVYSLVVYYLTKSDPATCNNTTWTWSCTAQIRRIQLNDAVTEKDPNNPNGVITIQAADPGFVLFNPQSVPKSEEDSMNAWPYGRSTAGATNSQVLIDYIDQTPLPADTPWCPSITRQRNPLPPGYDTTTASRVPVTPASAGFLACVDVENTTAQISIRGNSLARIQPKIRTPQYIDIPSVSTYFPTVRIQVQGRGVFKINQKS